MIEPIVNSEWLKQNLVKQNLIILDSSPTSNISNLKSEHEGVQIVGARYFDLKNKFSDKEAEMPNTLPNPEQFQKGSRALGINKDSIIIIYDNIGIYTSPRVKWMFNAMGHKEVAVLDGGLPEWINNNGAIEKSTKKEYSLGNFEATPIKSSVKDMEEVKEMIGKEDYIILDARSEGRFNGTSPEPREGLSSGHIPNSKNLPYTNVLSDGRMKPKEELEKIFDNISIDDKPITFSCGSGLTACIVLLGAEIISKKSLSVYDGSWTEWAQKQKSLIEKG